MNTVDKFEQHLDNSSKPLKFRPMKTNNGKGKDDIPAVAGDKVMKLFIEVKDDSFDLSHNGMADALMSYLTTDDYFDKLVSRRELSCDLSKASYTDTSFFNYETDANKPKNIICLSFDNSSFEG
tara:strand:- start:1003 stop:1374 length:372 start_codon:yes stop_codon:yes gene_type:complete